MARLASLGYESNTNTANVEWTTTGGSPTIQTSVVHGGTYAGEITGLTTGSRKGWLYQFSSNTAANGPFFARFYFRYATLPSATSTIFTFTQNTSFTSIIPRVNLRLTSAGTLQIFDTTANQIGSNSPALSANQWYEIELKFDNTQSIGSRIIEGKIDGLVFATTTTDSSSNSAGVFAIGGNLGAETQSAGDWFFDDIAINDSTGTNQNGYPGPGAIVHLQPNAAGDNNQFVTQVGGTAGSANNYTRVDEVTPDDATSYNADVTSGDIDDYRLISTPASIASGDTVAVVSVGVRYSGASASSDAAFVTRVKAASNGTVSESSPITPASTSWQSNAGSAPRNYSLITYTDPDGNAWKKSTLDTAQIGMRISTTGANAAQISTIWLSIDSAPIINDAVTISESVTVSLGGAISFSVNDSTTTSESVTVSLSENLPVVFDSTTTSEDITVDVIDLISVNDATSTSESLTITLVQTLQVNDSVSTSENLSIVETHNPTVSETVTASESVSLFSDMRINVNDATTTSESIVMQKTVLISVSDTSTTSENLAITKIYTLSVSESITTSESITIFSNENRSVFDSTTVSESITVRLGIDISPSDAVTTSESVTTYIPFYLISIAEFQQAADNRRNFVTNPSFEADSVGTNPPSTYVNFTTINTGTLTRGVSSDASGDGGLQSWKITEAGGTADAGLTSPQYSVVPGNYTVSYSMKTALSVGNAHMHAKVYSGGVVTAEYDATSISGTTAWTRYSLSFTLGVNDTAIELWIGAGAFSDAFFTGSVWYDAVQIEQGSTAFGYFDGSFAYAQWDGLANASSSSTSYTVETVDNVDLVSVSDAVTTSESFTIKTDKNINLSEAVTVTENFTVNSNIAPDINISVNDAPVTSENIIVLRASTFDIQNIFETVTTAESVSITNIQGISVSDSSHVVEGFVNMLNFNGSNQDVVTSFNSILHPTTAITVEAWAFHINWTTDTTTRDLYSNTQNGGFALRINDTGQTLPAVGFTVRANNTFQAVSTSMSSFITGWHFFTGTFDGRFVRIYVDGVLKNTRDLGSTFAIQYSFNNGSGIGSSVDQNSPANGVGNYWSEQIGQVRVYSNRALTAGEVTDHYNQKYTDETGLASAYYFAEGTGSTTADASANGITGTLVNSPTWQRNTMPQAGAITIDSFISVSDSATTSESVKTETTQEPFAGDDVTTSEDVTVYVPFLGVDTGDDISTDEFVNILYATNLVLEDDVTTSEDLAITSELNISASESTTVSENIVLSYDNIISVSESINVIDTISFFPSNNIVTVDSVTSSESISFSGDVFISVNDATTTSESIQLLGTRFISVSDSTTVTESQTVSIINFASLIDSASISENLAIDIDDLISVSDSTSTSEFIAFHTDTFYQVNVAEILQNIDDIQGFEIVEEDLTSVSDSATTSESVHAQLDFLVNLSDAVTTSESVTPDLPITISLSDSSTTSESITITEVDLVANSDSVTAAENIAIQLPEIISTSDAVVSSESINFAVNNDISVNDSTSTSESFNVLEIDTISAFDASATSESITIKLSVNISVSDTSITTDVSSLGFATLNVSISDSTTTSEVIVIGQININVAEAVTVIEFWSVLYPREIIVSDRATIVDFAQLRTPDAPPPVLKASTYAQPDPVSYAFTDGGENI